MNKFLSLVSLSVVLFFSACQKESDENTVSPAKSKPAAASKAPTGRVAGTSAATDLFVLAGGHIYRVSATTRQATIIGSDWAGTEAMTVNPYNNCIYGVQGGHFWRYSLSNGTVVDYGPGWGGTEAMTNNTSTGIDGDIFAVQGGALWVVATGSTYVSKVGNGNWSGTIDMSHVYLKGAVGNGNIHAIQGGAMWAINPVWGYWAQKNTNVDFSGVAAFVNTPWDYFYVRAGRLWKNGIQLGTTDWTGTQAITYAGGYMWIVKNSVVYQVDYNNGSVIATVPGITNAYGVESYECK